MTLTSDERALLCLIAASPAPVAMSSFFERVNTAPRLPIEAPDDDPVRVAWTERQMGLYGASVELWRRGLVRVVEPANGQRPDLVEATDAGRAALV